MITAWSFRPNSYPSRTKIKVTLSLIINHYLSIDPFHFDACDISVTSFTLDATRQKSSDLVVNTQQRKIFSLKIFDKQYIIYRIWPLNWIIWLWIEIFDFMFLYVIGSSLVHNRDTTYIVLSLSFRLSTRLILPNPFRQPGKDSLNHIYSHFVKVILMLIFAKEVSFVLLRHTVVYWKVFLLLYSLRIATLCQNFKSFLDF